MANPLERLRKMSIPPVTEITFNNWLHFQDAVAFLKENALEKQFVLYANLPSVYLNAMLVPLIHISPPDVDDLMRWSSNEYSSWGVFTSSHPTPTIAVSPPLCDSGSEVLAKGEQLIFAREFEGQVGEKHYFEILQKFLHLSDLHYLSERNAYCRLDRHGDVEDVIRVHAIDHTDGQISGGVIITVMRDVLDRYAMITDSTVVRRFDFTRAEFSRFGGWKNSHETAFTKMDRLFFRSHIEPGHASYMRGCQIVPSQVSKEAVMEEFLPGSNKSKQYASFLAHDWKNKIVKEISCAPEATSNYFTESDLPYELSPAFFRPEVLSKYKADFEKYRLDERRISCRGTWSLQTYDINEEGQVHTYLVYLRNLPFEEQLHWKAHNEEPKGGISHRAFLQDFEGSWDELYDPLESIKEHVRRLRDGHVTWWTLHSEDTIQRSHYPVTASPDEWANEILNLDQLVVEPLNKTWFKMELIKLGGLADPQAGSLVLAEKCLAMWGFDPDEAKKIVSPLRILHDLRSKLKGHAIGKSTRTRLRQEALDEHGSYKSHFRALCKVCDESLRIVSETIASRAVPA